MKIRNIVRFIPTPVKEGAILLTSWVLLGLLGLGMYYLIDSHGVAPIGYALVAMLVSLIVICAIHVGAQDCDDHPSTWRWFLNHKYNPIVWVEDVDRGGEAKFAESFLVIVFGLALLTIEILPIVLLAMFGKPGKELD